MNWVGDWAGRRAALTPDRLALIDANSHKPWSYTELNQAANGMAHYLVGEGFEQGDVIALIDGNTIASILLFLACGKLGLILAPVSYRLAPAEMAALLERIQPKQIVTASAHVQQLEHAGIEQFTLTSQLVSAVEPQRPVPNCNCALPLEAVCLYVHTGGSTGLPKICRVTHRQMIWNAIELLVSAPEGLSNRRELLLFPLFHIGGWNTLLPVLYGGGCVVVHDGFDPNTVLALIERYQINHFGAVEAMLNALAAAENFAGADLTSLKSITTAGAPCSASAMAAFFDRHIAVTQAYGLTEAGPSNCFNSPQDQSITELQNQTDTIGTGFYHCDHQIVDPNTQQVLGRGEIGELWLRSPHAFDGYLGDPQATAARITREGWVRSGDLAWEDDQGKLRIVGRVDNVIVSGGENISAEEIEQVLVEHPDIQAAVVFSVADVRWGQAPVAQVTVTQPTSEESVRAWLESRLARFKHPRVIEFVDHLPLTGAGKLDRRAAQKTYKEK